jgi:hypothetical protein
VCLPGADVSSQTVMVRQRRTARYPPLCAATWSPRRLARAAPIWMFCVRSLPAAQRPCQRFGSADERAHSPQGPGCRSTGDQWLRRSGQPRGPGFTSGPRGAAPRPRLRSMRRPALSDRRQGKSCSSAAGRLRSDAAGTSPPAISLAEHRVEFGVGPNLPDLLRAAAGDGDLGSPLQRLLA